MSELINKSPSYYIRKRLFANKPAMFGLTVIIISHIIVALGYAIMPDNTPNVNNGSEIISKKTPGFKTKILKIRLNREVEERNFFERVYQGQENSYSETPISSYRIAGDSVYFTIGKEPQEQAHFLLHAVKALSFEKGSIKKKNDEYTFVDVMGEVNTITLEKLISEFEQNNIEERTYYLGTDLSGRDMLSMLLFGLRISLSIGFISVMISLLLGVSLGAFAGFFGGTIDALVSWLMTVVWSVPSIMLVIAISMALGKGVWVAFVAVGLTMWVEIARVVRGEIMALKQKLYIEAAQAFGMNNFYIIYRHILPNLIGSLIVITTSIFASAILVEAGLSFLGLGVQPPTPSWGMMISAGSENMFRPNSWHLVFLPSFCISLLVLSFNLLGNGLRDAYDPKGLIRKK